MLYLVNRNAQIDPMDTFVHNLDFGDLPSATLNPIISNPVSASSLIAPTPLTGSAPSSSTSSSSSPHQQAPSAASANLSHHLTSADEHLTAATVPSTGSVAASATLDHHLIPSPVGTLAVPTTSCVIPPSAIPGLNPHSAAAAAINFQSNFIPSAAVTQFPTFLPQSILAQSSAQGTGSLPVIDKSSNLHHGSNQIDLSNSPLSAICNPSANHLSLLHSSAAPLFISTPSSGGGINFENPTSSLAVNKDPNNIKRKWNCMFFF